MSPMIHDVPDLMSCHQFQDNHHPGWGLRSYVCRRCIIKDYPGEAGTASNAMHFDTIELCISHAYIQFNLSLFQNLQINSTQYGLF